MVYKNSLIYKNSRGKIEYSGNDDYGPFVVICKLNNQSEIFETFNDSSEAIKHFYKCCGLMLSMMKGKNK